MTTHILLALMALALGGVLAWKGRRVAGGLLVLVALTALAGLMWRP